MDFGSSHVYEYEDSGEEYISDEELQVGMYLRCEPNFSLCIATPMFKNVIILVAAMMMMIIYMLVQTQQVK